MDGGLSRSSSTVTASSTLRPRGPKAARPASDTALAPPLNSLSRSRSRSPLAQSHSPHRSESAKPSSTFNGRASHVDNHRLQSKGSAPSLAALWGTSWTAIQGIANDLLATDGSDSESLQRRRPPRSGFLRSASGTQINNTKQWGPQGDVNVSSSIGQGSGQEERDALVRAQKRKDLLSGGPSVGYADGSGRFKRRTSDDRGALTDTGNDQGLGDALVYVHHVEPQDTLAGITIKYGCSAATLRKANRMWPNDSIQIKKVLVLPVTACSVKGRPTGPPEKETEAVRQHEEVLLEEQPARLRAESFSNNSQKTSTSARSASELEQSWMHDSWSLLHNTTAPVQIVRLPRRVLGYFPPARRKSQSNSDLDSRTTSFEVGRQSTSDDPVPISPARLPPRQRRASNATNVYFPSYLAGPGGVGTMDRNVKSPGPAQDGLNKMFANHLPNVAPPPNQHGLYQPDTPLFIENLAGFLTPSLDSGRQSPRINLENVGGAIESWMRKVATKASSVLEPQDRREPARISAGQAGRGAGSVGDLIEMADSFDIGHEDEDSDTDRGRQGAFAAQSLAVGASSSQSNGAAESQARSRVRSTGKSAAGKDD